MLTTAPISLEGGGSPLTLTLTLTNPNTNRLPLSLEPVVAQPTDGLPQGVDKRGGVPKQASPLLPFSRVGCALPPSPSPPAPFSPPPPLTHTRFWRSRPRPRSAPW